MTADFDATARAYLLGQLPDEQAAALEQSLLLDGDRLEQVEAIEHDLLEDYIGGELTADDRVRFEHHYLASAAHRERLALSRGLAARAEREGVASSLPHARSGPNAATLQDRTRLGMRPAMLAWAAAAALLAAIAGWLALRPISPAPSPAPIAADAPRATPAPEAPTHAPSTAPAVREPVRIALSLSPVITRSRTATARLVIPAGASLVDLQLQGNRASHAEAALEVRSVDDRLAWTGTATRPAAERPDAPAWRVTVPADRLTPDDYIVTVADADGQALARYFFRVAREP